MYASGRLTEFKEWMCTLDKYKVFGLVDFTLSSEGLVKGDRVMKAMQELIPDVQIEQIAGSVCRRGGRSAHGARGGARPRRVVRGYPGLDLHPFGLPAVHRDGMVLVDGGTVNPLPLTGFGAKRVTCWSPWM